MLFNSYVFVFLFLPLTLLVFRLLGAGGFRQAAKIWLVAASLFFYGWWNPVYLAFIAPLILFNFACGLGLARLARRAECVLVRRLLLTAGIAVNLGVLGYFKYANFFVENFNRCFAAGIEWPKVVLPLGISFFTFQKIAYLVDASQGKVTNHSLVNFSLFVLFFPQLIAGPIVHHADIMPQFRKRAMYALSFRNLALGLTLLSIGLFKKVVLADGMAHFASPVFTAASVGTVLTPLEAWGGALAYTLQLYLDFSGYSDMALGLGTLFGIHLAVNFNSPYKALNIAEFWKRWHITLSQFLRDYLYIPLGGNRRGKARRYINLMLTMLLGGLWHGAGWTFVIWGGLHGFYLCVFHAWRAIKGRWMPAATPTPGGRAAGWGLTFLAVIAGWVFFRSPDFRTAFSLLASMAGRHGLYIRYPFANGVFSAVGFAWIGALIVMVLGCPNSGEFARQWKNSARGDAEALPVFLPWRWRPTLGWAAAIATIFVISVLKLSDITEFLYFQF